MQSRRGPFRQGAAIHPASGSFGDRTRDYLTVITLALAELAEAVTALVIESSHGPA